MNSPATRFITLLYLLRKPIMVSAAAVETAAKTNKGNPIPMPKNRNRSMFSRKAVETVLVKRAAIKRGLQGTTIAPKKKPKRKALAQGFLETGV